MEKRPRRYLWPRHCGMLRQASSRGSCVSLRPLSAVYEKDPSTGAATKYYKLGGALIAVRDTSLHYLGHDHLNSTTLQTSASSLAPNMASTDASGGR